MTALGLFVAVPAVMGYNWLLRRNKGISESLRNFASDLHAYLVGGARVSQGTPVAGGRSKDLGTQALRFTTSEVAPNVDECRFGRRAKLASWRRSIRLRSWTSCSCC